MFKPRTADGKAIIFTSNRAGEEYNRVYKQFLSGDTPKVIDTGSIGYGFDEPRVSPDGKWVVGISYPKSGGSSETAELMRVPITGGSPELVFPVARGVSGSCARSSPSNLCAVAEVTEDHKRLTITSFDPVKGRGPELARFDLDRMEATRSARSLQTAHAWL